MRCERGQATIEWVGLVLLASLVLAALATALPTAEGRSYGVALAGRILCATTAASCGSGDRRVPAEPDTQLVSRSGVPDIYRHTAARLVGPVRDIPAHRQTGPVPCDRYWCDVVIRQCEVAFTERAGEAFCKARAAAAGRPSALARFIEARVSGCLVGAVGAKAFEPFAEELLRRDATRSAKNAWQALGQGYQRAKHEVAKGKVKPGVIGCIGGAVGL